MTPSINTSLLPPARSGVAKMPATMLGATLGGLATSFPTDAMPLTASDTAPPSSHSSTIASTTKRPPTRPAFSNLLEDSQKQLDAQAERRAKAEEAAAGLVSNALILPVLKQLRRSSFGENPVFSGGNGEKMFGPQFDMQLADRIAHSPNLGIKNVLADRLMKRGPQASPVQRKGLDVHG